MHFLLTVSIIVLFHWGQLCFCIKEIPSETTTSIPVTSLPTDVPDIGNRQPRIMTEEISNIERQGNDRKKRNQIIELPTSLGLAIGTIEITDGVATDLQSPGRQFFSFRGIPYAKPPIGPLRWSDPQPIIQWEGGTLDATNFRNFCPQFDTNTQTIVGNEDCLYLNVYTPALPGHMTGNLPVLVFIHGGAYTRGSSSSHGPNFLLREDIVLVTINYRLGVFGFLSTDDDVLPGNYGLLDQVEALKWVERHIADFGGDPSSVTLGGFSAGSAFVHFHLLSPMSQGLFHKAIMMSGAANCLWSVQEDPWPIAQQLSRDTNCGYRSSSAIKECLLLKDTETLIGAQTNRTRYVYWPMSYRPVIDAEHREKPFLPFPVRQLIHQPYPSTVPVIVGAVPEDGLLFALTTIMFNGDSSSPGRVYQDALPYVFQSLWPNNTSSEAVAESIMSYYLTDYSKDNINTLMADLTEAMTDLFFTQCVWDAASSLTKGPAYLYLMTHHEPDSISMAAGLYQAAETVGVTSPLLKFAVSHGDDLCLLFNVPLPGSSFTQGDRQMSRILTSMWGSFVKTGSPQSGSPIASSFSTWQPSPLGEPLIYYRLSLSPTMINRPFRYKERNFWRQVLAPVEESYYAASIGWSWSIVAYILIIIIIIFIIISIILFIKLRRSKRGTSISNSLPTLRKQLRKPSNQK